MNTQLVNRLDAFRSVLTLQNQFGSQIQLEPILRSTFEKLGSKLLEADPLLAQIAGRSNAHTVEKDSKRGDALDLGRRLGSALFVLAVRTKNDFLRAKCADWRSVSALGKGNREAVVGRLRALLTTLRENARELVPDHVTEADINEMEAKIEAFSQSLSGKAESLNGQKARTAGFAQLVSEISSIVNDELTPTVNSLTEELPELAAAYKIARKVRSTAAPSRSASEKKSSKKAQQELEMALKAKLALPPQVGMESEPVRFKIAPSGVANGVENAAV